jgi:hypothetical protein
VLLCAVEVNKYIIVIRCKFSVADCCIFTLTSGFSHFGGVKLKGVFIRVRIVLLVVRPHEDEEEEKKTRWCSNMKMCVKLHWKIAQRHTHAATAFLPCTSGRGRTIDKDRTMSGLERIASIHKLHSLPQLPYMPMLVFLHSDTIQFHFGCCRRCSFLEFFRFFRSFCCLLAKS